MLNENVDLTSGVSWQGNTDLAWMACTVRLTSGHPANGFMAILSACRAATWGQHLKRYF